MTPDMQAAAQAVHDAVNALNEALTHAVYEHNLRAEVRVDRMMEVSQEFPSSVVSVTVSQVIPSRRSSDE